MRDLTVIIPFRGTTSRRKRIFDWVINRYMLLFPESSVIVADSSPQEQFNRSQAINAAAVEAKTQYILISDSDTIVFRPFIENGVKALENGANWVIPYGIKGYFNLKKPYSDKILASPYDIFITPDEFEFVHQIESWSGLVLFKTVDFIHINGMDERFKGWGYEDNALQKAADTLIGPYSRLEYGWTAHLWHEAPQHETWEQPNISRNRSLHSKYASAYGNIDAMSELVRGNTDVFNI